MHFKLKRIVVLRNHFCRTHQNFLNNLLKLEEVVLCVCEVHERWAGTYVYTYLGQNELTISTAATPTRFQSQRNWVTIPRDLVSGHRQTKTRRAFPSLSLSFFIKKNVWRVAMEVVIQYNPRRGGRGKELIYIYIYLTLHCDSQIDR